MKILTKVAFSEYSPFWIRCIADGMIFDMYVWDRISIFESPLVVFIVPVHIYNKISTFYKTKLFMFICKVFLPISKPFTRHSNSDIRHTFTILKHIFHAVDYFVQKNVYVNPETRAHTNLHT